MSTNVDTNAVAYLNLVKVEAVLKAANALSLHVGKTSRTGGVMAILVVDPRDHGQNSLASLSFGQPGLKISGNLFNAHEKIHRLHERRWNSRDGIMDVASSQSANNTTTYGGCILFRDNLGRYVYISYSGAPPEVDEAISFVAGVKLPNLIAPQGYVNPLIDRAFRLMS